MFGCCLSACYSITALYLQELIQKSKRFYMMTLLGICEGVLAVGLVLYYVYVTNEWKPWYFAIAVVYVPVIALVAWMPDSPEFYYSKGRFEESEGVIHRIAQVNGVIIPPDSLQFRQMSTSQTNEEESTKMEQGKSTEANA
jgi:hypothetical protein